MKPKIIKTEADYEAVLSRIEAIFDAQPGTDDGDELELLTTLVELYEAEQFPINWPDPLTAIRFRMEQQGLQQKDLVPFIGSPSKVSEVLSGQRRLSLTMIKKLVDGFGIPAAVLVHQPVVAPAVTSAVAPAISPDAPRAPQKLRPRKRRTSGTIPVAS